MPATVCSVRFRRARHEDLAPARNFQQLPALGGNFVRRGTHRAVDKVVTANGPQEQEHEAQDGLEHPRLHGDRRQAELCEQALGLLLFALFLAHRRVWEGCGNPGRLRRRGWRTRRRGRVLEGQRHDLFCHVCFFHKRRGLDDGLALKAANSISQELLRDTEAGAALGTENSHGHATSRCLRDDGCRSALRARSLEIAAAKKGNRACLGWPGTPSRPTLFWKWIPRSQVGGRAQGSRSATRKVPPLARRGQRRAASVPKAMRLSIAFLERRL